MSIPSVNAPLNVRLLGYTFVVVGNGKTEEVNRPSAYVERESSLPSGVDFAGGKWKSCADVEGHWSTQDIRTERSARA